MHLHASAFLSPNHRYHGYGHNQQYWFEIDKRQCTSVVLMEIWAVNHRHVKRRRIECNCIQFVSTRQEYNTVLTCYNKVDFPKNTHMEGILPNGPYLPCVSMGGRALLAGYHRYMRFVLQLTLKCKTWGLFCGFKIWSRLCLCNCNTEWSNWIHIIHHLFSWYMRFIFNKWFYILQ